MDSDISHASDCVFYDAELKKLRLAFKDADKILKDISKRAERRQTVQISKSLFDYSERSRDFRVVPQKYFDFRLDNYRICLFVYKGKISVLCVGFELPFPADRVDDFVGSGSLYYRLNSFNSAVKKFRQAVKWFLDSYAIKFEYDDVLTENIPF